jgi:putative addiction module antidote
MIVTEIRQVGNSDGTLLPKELMQDLKAKRGDQLYWVKVGDRHYVDIHDSNFAKKMQVIENVMHDYKDALKALSKK